MEKRIIINDYIENDPLSENNLDKTLDLINKIRILCPNKSIWLYTGCTFEEIFEKNQFEDLDNGYSRWTKRAIIVSRYDVLVDGEYIDSQKDSTLKWRGSKNQRVIDIQKSLQKGEIILWAT